MAKIRADRGMPSPYEPEDETLHAGKVFVMPQGVLKAVGATASDGSDLAELKNRLLLCLWDVDDDRSVWLSVQSKGDFQIPHPSKLLLAGDDPNWMDPDKVSRYRAGTLWILGQPGKPVKFTQPQKRAVTNEELATIRARFSPEAVTRFIDES